MDKVYEFLSAVRDKCLHKKAALNLQTGAQAGFRAPTEAVDEIYQQLDRLPFFKKCTLVDCETGEAKYPIADMHINAADDETAFAAGVTFGYFATDRSSISRFDTRETSHVLEVTRVRSLARQIAAIPTSSAQ